MSAAAKKSVKGKRTRRHGDKISSQLWLTAEQHALIKAAAKADGRSMVNFAMRATLDEARRIVANK